MFNQVGPWQFYWELRLYLWTREGQVGLDPGPAVDDAGSLGFYFLLGEKGAGCPVVGVF